MNPAYRKTELGLIPDDWTPLVLHEACKRISVGLATSVTKHYRASGVPIVRNSNIKCGFFDGSDILFISEEFAKANRSKAARALDVLTVRTGANLGDTCVLPPALDDCQTFTTLITTPKPAVLDPHFLCLNMISFMGRKEITRLQVGSGKGNLNTGNLKRYRLAAPPLPEQKAIAEAAHDINSLIESLQKLIAKSRALKQGAMQDLLSSRRRLPEFSADWGSKAFGALYEKVYERSSISSGDGNEYGAYPLYVSGSESKRIDTALYRGAEALIFSDGGVFSVRYVRGDFSVSDHCHTLKLRADVADMRFVTAWFDLNRKRMDRLTFKGSGLRNLNKTALANVQVPVPELKEQAAIAEVLEDMEADIAAREAMLHKFLQIREGMMQRLLTGSIRLR